MIVAKWFTNLGNQCSLPAVQGDRPGNDPSRIDTFERTKFCLTQLSCHYCDPNILGLLAFCVDYSLWFAMLVVWSGDSTIPPLHHGVPAIRQLAQLRKEPLAPQCTSGAMPPRVRPSWAGTPLALSKRASELLLLWGVPILMRPVLNSSTYVCIFVRIRASFFTS